jgi:hypothetical protein
MKIIIIISLSLLTCLKAINSPIVIIPGLAGNQLEAKIDKKNTVNWMCKKNQDWFRIWFSLTEFLPLIVNSNNHLGGLLD